MFEFHFEWAFERRMGHVASKGSAASSPEKSYLPLFTVADDKIDSIFRSVVLVIIAIQVPCVRSIGLIISQ